MTTKRTNQADKEIMLVVRELSEKAKKTGGVGYREVDIAADRYRLGTDKICELYEQLEKNGVAISDVADAAQNGQEYAEVFGDEDAFGEDRSYEADYEPEGSVLLFLKDMAGYPLLTREREKELAQRMASGDREAREEFINSNLRLVISVAKSCKSRCVKSSFSDLIQDGNEGLIKAVDRFDFSLGYRFSTYATWWIRQAITRSYSETADTLRIPSHAHETIGRINRISRDYFQRYGREATDAEVACELKLTPEKVRTYRTAALSPVPMDNPVNEDGDCRIGDLIEDTSVPSVEQQVETVTVNEAIVRALSLLSEREEKVIRMRYGIGPDEPKTLREIGLTLGITRERVRQIEAKALRKLRRPGGPCYLGDCVS